MSLSQLDLFGDFHSIKNGSETRKCHKCKKEKPLDLFRLRDRGASRRTECKSCENGLKRQSLYLRKVTPPPPEDYICPICLKNEEEVKGRGGKNNGSWVLDHDHRTGEFRGYLCYSCNRNIGGFGDSIDRMLRAIKYLERD